MMSSALMSGAAVAARAPVRLRGPAPSSSARHHRCPNIDSPHGRPRRDVRRALVRASASAVDAQQAEYASWRESKSIKSPNVEVAYFGDVDDEVMRYRGVKATSAVNAGDVLVELPRESCLVLMDDAELPFPEFCTNELWAKLTEQNKWAVKVALNLLHERSLGAGYVDHTGGYSCQCLPNADRPPCGDYPDRDTDQVRGSDGQYGLADRDP